MTKILLIDDDDSVRDMLAKTLTHLGYHVTEARNGKQGLEVFAQLHPDVVITDIVMPEKEGLEVLMELRTIKPPVKIIAMSGGGRGSSADYLHLARAFGASKVFAKPFSTEVLVAAIEELLAADAPSSVSGEVGLAGNHPV